MLNLPENKRCILFVCAGLLCFLSAFALLQTFKGRFEQASDLSQLPEAEETIEISAADSSGPQSAAEVGHSAAKWVVYVTGSVRKPGVYELPAGSRVYHALEAAGGFAGDADREAVNLASTLKDGDHIKFPSKSETKVSPQSRSRQPSFVRPSGSSDTAERPRPLNLNTCAAGELERLPGIGPNTARSILERREAGGGFKKKEDLLLVKGVGPKKYDAIRELVTVEL